MSKPKPFRPVSPAEMLREMLEHPSLAHLLEATLPVGVRAVLNGSRPVGPMEARAIACLLVTSDSYWLRLQELYDEDVRRLANTPAEPNPCLPG